MGQGGTEATVRRRSPWASPGSRGSSGAVCHWETEGEEEQETEPEGSSGEKPGSSQPSRRRSNECGCEMRRSRVSRGGASGCQALLSAAVLLPGARTTELSIPQSPGLEVREPGVGDSRGLREGSGPGLSAGLSAGFSLCLRPVFHVQTSPFRSTPDWPTRGTSLELDDPCKDPFPK